MSNLRLRRTFAEDWQLIAMCVALAGVLAMQIYRIVAAWTLEGMLAMVSAGAMFAGAIVVSHRIVRGIQWRRPIRFPTEPPPPTWTDIIRKNVPLASRLSPDSFQHLLKLVQVFIAKKRFEGARGFEITEEVQVTIAAHASLLLLRLDIGMYPGLHTIIVYPDAFVTEPKSTERVATLGQSWSTGVVILSWDSVLHGAFDPKDGLNVALHEFAHQLDQSDGTADGVPVGLQPTSVGVWAAAIGKYQAQLRRARRKNRRYVMDHYGATNRAEFFAVATETFLEKPHQLRSGMPDLFEMLVDFYGWDPTRELTARGFNTEPGSQKSDVTVVAS